MEVGEAAVEAVDSVEDVSPDVVGVALPSDLLEALECRQSISLIS